MNGILTVEESIFINNTSNEGAIFLSFENDRGIILKMRSCFFSYNYANYSLFSLENANLHLIDCIFEKNSNTVFGIDHSELLLENISISNHFCFNNYLGCIIVSETGSNVTIIKSFFLNITSTTKGNIYIGDSAVKIFESLFVMVISQQYIGSCMNSVNSNLLINSSFFINFAFNCVYLLKSSISMFQVEFNSNFKTNMSIELENKLYGTIVCESCDLFYVNKSFFKNQNNIYQGGSILLIQKNSVNKSEYFVENSFFVNNTANYAGGNLFLINTNLVLVNNIFYMNTASIGGVIFYDASKNESNLTLKNNFFIKNKGFLEGGAIKWTFIEPNFLHDNYYQENEAIYGKNIATLPIRMNINIISHDKNKTILENFQKDNTEKIPFLYNLLSTYQMNFTLGLEMTDIYGEKVTTVGKNKFYYYFFCF